MRDAERENISPKSRAAVRSFDMTYKSLIIHTRILRHRYVGPMTLSTACPREQNTGMYVTYVKPHITHLSVLAGSEHFVVVRTAGFAPTA